jgi:ankyrin repeat protein
MQNQPQLVEMLLKMRKRTPKEMAQAGAAAFATGNLETLDVLRRGHAFQDRDKWGTTVLHSEFQHGQGSRYDERECIPLIARIQWLVNDQHNDIQARERVFGNTALHLACWYQYPKSILETLISLGADPKASNTFEWTPLHLCARYSMDPESVQLLLNVGGNSMASKLTRGGSSPLHWAAETKYIEDHEKFMDVRVEVMRRLLKAGADPKLHNARGETPLSLAGASVFNQAVIQNVYTGFDRISEPPLAQAPDSDLDLEFPRQVAGSLLRSHAFDSDSDILDHR